MLITRRPFVAANVGRMFAGDRIGGAMQRVSEGSLEIISAADGAVRILSYQRLDAWPLVVIASLDKDEVLSQWRTDAIRDAALTFVVIALLGFGLRQLTREIARRTAAEKRRRAEAEALRVTLDNMAQGLMMVDAQGRMGTYNRRALELLDLPESLLARRPLASEILAFQAARGEFAGASTDAISKINPLNGVIYSVYERRRPDGAVLEVRTTPLSDGGVVRTYTDITERKAMEDALAASEEQYRDLMASTTSVITRLRLDLTREYVSPTCRQMLGYEPDEMLGAKPERTTHPDDEPEVFATAQRLIAGECAGDRATVFYRTRHKDGRWIWIEGGLRLARHPSTGEPQGIVCTLQDVTARRQAEQALQDSEARFRTLADNATDLVTRLGLDLKRRYVSPSSLDLLGYAPEELIDATPDELVHAEDTAALDAALRPLAAGEADRSDGLYRMRRKDGAWIWIEGRFRLLRHSDGSPREIFATGRDVTERERHAEELRLAKERAEAASQAKSAFVATMSHEIRTPLNAVIGFTGLILERGDLPSEARRQLELIRASGWSLLTVVNDILDFSKIEAGVIDIETRPFELARLGRECAGVVSGLAEQKGLRLAVACDADLPAQALGDESRLRQVILNLLNNAVKFTAEGSVTLSIEKGPGDRVTFAVQDSGVGIARDQQDKLFRDFSQIDAGANRQFGGSGLGLAICKRIVERMGGAIGVESDAGAGARFWFTLPLPAAPDNVASDDADMQDAAQRAQAAKSILVVDDLAINRELAAGVLRAAGHAVDCVDGAESAIAAVQDKAYDLIFMDVQMPGVDGLEATRRIRALGGRAGATPVVALTANVYADQIAAIADAGMDGHVGKPFGPADLRAAVDRFAASAGNDRLRPIAAVQTHIGAADKEAREELKMIFGVEQYAELVRSFAQDLAQRFASEDHPTLAEDAHKVVASAGMLGFLALSNAARALEDACRDRQTDVPATLAEARAQRRAALGELGAA